jgi:multiple sugar transport system permease protein
MKMLKQHHLSAAGFLAPNFVGFLVFLLVPLAVSFAMSFTDWHMNQSNPATSLVRPEATTLQFVGLRHYKDLLGSGEFWTYFINTIYFMLGIPFGIAGSLILAMMLSEPLKANSTFGKFIHATIALLLTGVALLLFFGFVGSNHDDAAGQSNTVRVVGWLIVLMGVVYVAGVFSGVVFFRTAFYLPSFVAGVAIFILWRNLYNSDFGPINLAINWLFDSAWSVVQWFDAEAIRPEWMLAPKWLTSTSNLLGLDPERPALSAKFFGLGAREALIFMGLVTSIGGGNMLLYLAGLASIPQELYEAAEIDGAGGWSRFWAVTWPQLAPTTFFIVVMSCIGGLQGGFDAAKTMTNGGPSDTTTTLSFYIYNNAFVYGNLGFACAVAWILFAMVFVVTLFNWRFGNRQTNE